MNHSRHRRFAHGILCLLCFLVALSFTAPLLSIVSASAGSNTMPCCAGKTGHCDSGITPKQVPPPTSEPMCGLKSATMEDDDITIVAEPLQTAAPHSHSRHAETSSSLAESLAEFDSSRHAAEADSLSEPCRMDCGACLTSLNRQQKRERALVQTSAFRSSSLNTTGRFEYQSLPSSSNEYWEQASPRGPPAHLL